MACHAGFDMSTAQCVVKFGQDMGGAIPSWQPQVSNPISLSGVPRCQRPAAGSLLDISANPRTLFAMAGSWWPTGGYSITYQ